MNNASRRAKNDWRECQYEHCRKAIRAHSYIYSKGLGCKKDAERNNLGKMVVNRVKPQFQQLTFCQTGQSSLQLKLQSGPDTYLWTIRLTSKTFFWDKDFWLNFPFPSEMQRLNLVIVLLSFFNKECSFLKRNWIVLKILRMYTSGKSLDPPILKEKNEFIRYVSL